MKASLEESLNFEKRERNIEKLFETNLNIWQQRNRWMIEKYNINTKLEKN